MINIVLDTNVLFYLFQKEGIISMRGEDCIPVNIFIFFVFPMKI